MATRKTTLSLGCMEFAAKRPWARKELALRLHQRQPRERAVLGGQLQWALVPIRRQPDEILTARPQP